MTLLALTLVSLRLLGYESGDEPQTTQQIVAQLVLRGYFKASNTGVDNHIVLHLPRTAPWGTTWQRAAVAVCA